ncbi:hypothetical protein A4D02_27730 [Niastella koreensis]|uniref:Transmembrane protein n=2 Tax=Niastella koreensis TaxID=354356 RepID=G8TI22_NIAKG|nr:hypothetical protein Niako_3306 [Niastella koreensis GR20-10]OQP49870.1 hypothetical protein A4D02_27730 [Niastella koreensis]
MTKSLLLDTKTFFRILINYFILTILWSIACFQFDRYFGENRFGLKAIGFVTLFSLSFAFGLGLRRFIKITLLLVIFLATFFIVSFVIGPLSANLVQDSTWLSGLIMSSVAATILVMTLNHIKRIEFIYPCILTTILFALPSYFTQVRRLEDRLYWAYDIHPSISMFNLWQGLTIISLSLGCCLSRQQPTVHA